MYEQQQQPQRKIRYFKDVHGRVYRSMFTAYQYNTDEQCIILREIATGRIIIVPAQKLYDVTLIDDKYVQNFTELQNYYDPYYGNMNNQAHMEYPGFTDDPRTFGRPIRRPYR